MPKPLTEDEIAFVDRTFTFHSPKGNQISRYGALRRSARDFAVMILGMAPDSPERDVAIERLSEASMWANAAIARNE